MKQVWCLWCFKEKAEGESGRYEFDEHSDFYFCSDKCFDNATCKIRGDVHVDMSKVREHARQLAEQLRGNDWPA